MKGIILMLALCIVSGYVITDYFTEPDFEEIQTQWLLCGMDMQILELDMKMKIDDNYLYTICDLLIQDGDYVGGLERTYESLRNQA